MKLLYITNGITGVGGLERVLSIKASYLTDKLEHQVHIASLNEVDKQPFYEFSPKIIFHRIEIGRNKLRYFTDLRRLVRDIKPDIILVCDDGLKGLFVPLWIGGGKAKIIYERHVSKEMITLGKEPNLRQKFTFKLMNAATRLFDRFVVLTNYNKSQWIGDNIEVIPNPLPFYPDSIPGVDQKRIIAVGKVSVEKGYERLWAAWQLIADRYPDWTVDIYGSSQGGSQLEKLATGKAIHVHKPVQAIIQEYQSSAIYALPSRFEGFGMVLIEAMACGVPCVAFDCPCGPRDIISNGTDGFLVENGNIEQFAQRLSILIDNKNLRMAMGQKARENVRRYDIEIIGRQWDTLFRELTKS